MSGRWSTSDGALAFVPRLPFARGTTYVLLRFVDVDAGTTPWVELARLLRPTTSSASTTTVIAIHPGAAEVPENLLRLSVTFSSPMEEGSAGDHIHLQDATGRDLDHALLSMPPELWDMPRRRLTLLLEPGRIKRGLAPNIELGAPLVRGTTVDLVVDASLRDAAGGSLAAGARRTYRVGPAIRSRVDPRRWAVTWPSPQSADPLVVDFDRPMDHALALRCLTATDSRGTPVPGQATLDRDDLRWSFLPHDRLRGGIARLHIDTALEDLAGNSARRVFDRDLVLERDDPHVAAEMILTPDHPADH